MGVDLALTVNVYRVISQAALKSWKRTARYNPLTQSDGAEWGGEARTYVWLKRAAADDYMAYLKRRARAANRPTPKLLVAELGVPDEWVHPEDDPSPVARHFGEVGYITVPIPWDNVVRIIAT